MMKMLEAGGIPVLTDSLRQADIDNPEGYYELESVKTLGKGEVNWLNDAEGHAIKIISALLVHLPVEYTYRVIFMQRDMQEIIESQRRMLIRRDVPPNADDDSHLPALYAKHLAKVSRWVSEQPNFTAHTVDYNSLVKGDSPAAIQKIIDFLQRPMDMTKMQQAITPSLYRNRS